MKIALTAIAIAVLATACATRYNPTPPENCGKQICAGAWAKCDDGKPVIILDVSSKNRSETPINFSYKLVNQDGTVVKEGAGYKPVIKNIIRSQEIPFSGETVTVHALSGDDDLTTPNVGLTCG